MQAQVDERCVIQANAQFWGQMLAMSLDHKPFSEEFSVDPGHVLASVGIMGAWNGRIEVRMATTLAYEATAAMMMQPVDTVTEADALDAVKEIANIIGGVIKPNLPRPCTMTVPESSIAPEQFASPKETEDSFAVAFHHDTGDMMVRIWEQEYVQQQAACA